LIESALKLRKHKPMFILDIAIPRDIEPEVAQLDDVFLYAIDDLQQVVEANINNRQEEKTLAEEIVITQNKKFEDWLIQLPNEKVVQDYRQNAYKIKDMAIESALKQLKKGDDTEAVMQKLADQLTNKLLHAPFNNIKQADAQQLKHCQNCIPKTKQS
jgi:glutamyl-tRNA reductase